MKILLAGLSRRLDLDLLDQEIAEFMRRWGVLALRLSLGIVFVWFGILKPLGLSPAEPLVKATVQWLPIFSPGEWLIVVGWWEVGIGTAFLFKSTLRVAIALLFLQMVGTFMPLVLSPEVTFQAGRLPYAPTIERPVHLQEPAHYFGSVGRWRDGP